MPDGSDWRTSQRKELTELVDVCWAQDHEKRPAFDVVAAQVDRMYPALVLHVQSTLGGTEAAAVAQAASEEAMRRALEAEEDLALVRAKLAEYELVQKQAAEGEARAVYTSWALTPLGLSITKRARDRS